MDSSGHMRRNIQVKQKCEDLLWAAETKAGFESRRFPFEANSNKDNGNISYEA